MDIWPYQTRTTHTTFSDKLKTVVYNNEFDYDEIKKLYHEKAACGRSTITSELCIEYNFKDNVTLKEI